MRESLLPATAVTRISVARSDLENSFHTARVKLRLSPEMTAASGAGGEADEIGSKPDIGIGMSEAGTKLDVPRTWPKLRFVAKSRHRHISRQQITDHRSPLTFQPSEGSLGLPPSRHTCRRRGGRPLADRPRKRKSRASSVKPPSRAICRCLVSQYSGGQGSDDARPIAIQARPSS